MFAITGITGQVGGGVARTLLDARKSVRAVIRDSAKGEMWAQQGCEVALARTEDPDALQRAFSRAEAVFVLLPPNFDPSPGFIETRQIVRSRTGGTTPRLSQRHRSQFRAPAESQREGDYRATQHLGSAIPLSGHEEPNAANPDVGWLQRGLDRIRT